MDVETKWPEWTPIKRRAKKKVASPTTKETTHYCNFRKKNTQSARDWRRRKHEEKTTQKKRLEAATQRRIELMATVERLEAELQELCTESADNMLYGDDFTGSLVFLDSQPTSGGHPAASKSE